VSGTGPYELFLERRLFVPTFFVRFVICPCVRVCICTIFFVFINVCFATFLCVCVCGTVCVVCCNRSDKRRGGAHKSVGKGGGVSLKFVGLFY